MWKVPERGAQAGSALSRKHLKTTSERPQSGPVIPLSSDNRPGLYRELSLIKWFRHENAGSNRVEPRAYASSLLPYGRRAGLFYDIGKFSLSYIIKSALRSDAHSHERQMSAKADHARRRGVMSLKRPNPGGESCKAGFYFIL